MFCSSNSQLSFLHAACRIISTSLHSPFWVCHRFRVPRTQLNAQTTSTAVAIIQGICCLVYDLRKVSVVVHTIKKGVARFFRHKRQAIPFPQTQYRKQTIEKLLSVGAISLKTKTPVYMHLEQSLPRRKTALWECISITESSTHKPSKIPYCYLESITYVGLVLVRAILHFSTCTWAFIRSMLTLALHSKPSILLNWHLLL